MQDFGTYSLDSCDYPEFGRAVAEAVACGECERALSSARPVSVFPFFANKVRGIQRGLCRNTTTARLTREHNNADVSRDRCRYGRRKCCHGYRGYILRNTFLNGEGACIRRIDKIEDRADTPVFRFRRLADLRTRIGTKCTSSLQAQAA